MVWLAVVLILTAAVFSWAYRFHLFSFYIYLLVQFEHRGRDYQLLSSLRENLVHERKKKIAGLEMILSTQTGGLGRAPVRGHPPSWERGEEIQPKYEYFEELLEQLKDLVWVERRNLMATTKDIWLWGKLWSMLLKIERASMEKREKFDVATVRGVLVRFTELTDQVVQSATQRFSFSLNDVVRESVKTVRVEKSQAAGISIEEELEDAGENVRFSYDNFRHWQRVLTNLIRNAFEAVEAKQSGAGGLGLAAPPHEAGPGGGEGVVADFSLRGRNKNLWVKVSTRESEKEGGQAGMPDLPGISVPVSVIIEDSGIGMDKATKSSFYKKGFTSGKEGGLGLGVSEESVQLIDQHGNWEIESEKEVGTKITINIDREKSKKAELILPPPKPFFRTRLAFGLSLFLLALIGLALLFTFDKYSRFWVDWNPVLVEVNENYLIVKNKSKDVLWDVRLPSRIMYSLPQKSEPLVRFADLDGDGRNEVLVAIDFTKETTGKILCFDHKKETLWEFACGDSGIYQGRNAYFSPVHILVEDLFGDSKKEIIVNSAHSIWFPDQLAILDEKGNKLSEYWHPGVFNFLDCSDFDNDGEKEIILAGGNNRMGWRPVISVLEPKRVFGQAMPYNAAKEIEKAKEEWYVVFPHIKKSLPDESEWRHFLSWVSNIRLFTEDDELQANLVDARNYFLTLNFELKNIYFNLPGFLGWKEKWKFSYDLTEEDKKNWENIEVWKEGKRIR